MTKVLKNKTKRMEKEMKKIIALLLVLVMSFCMFSCDIINKTPDNGGENNGGENNGNENNGGNETPAPEKVRYEVPAEGYDGSAVTIKFSHTMGQTLQTVLAEYIAVFNEKYPNITIETASLGGYPDLRDQIKQELTAGNQPHIAYCYPDHVALYNLTKKVVPLDNFIESDIVIDEATGEILGLTDEQIANFIDGYYAEGTAFDAAGTMYTLPMSKSTEVLYYNKTFFDQYDLKVPTTWEEMETVCEQIRAILDNPANNYANASISYPLGYDSEANWFITLCEQYGSNYTSATGTKFLFNNAKNRAFVTELREWYDKGYFTTEELFGGYTSDLFKNQDPEKGSIYMCIGSSAGAQYQVPSTEDGLEGFEVGITSIPQVNPSAPKAISQGPSLCMFDHANKQEVVASWLFVKFLTTTPEFQAQFSMVSGYIPVIEKDILIEALPAYGTWLETGLLPGETVATAKNIVISSTISTALAQADSYFVSPAFNGSSKARDVVGELMQYCFVTQADDINAMIEKAFKDAVAECVADA